MKAWQVHDYGEPAEVLRLGDVADPVPGPGRLVVRVAAAALNFPDVLLCRGQYQERPPLPFVPGVEVCGEVVAVGDGVTRARPGDRVIGLPAPPAGGLAELTVVEDAGVFAVLPELSAAQNAALVVTYQTGYVGLRRRAALQPGETLLVHAGASGTGSAAIQLGRAMGARVLATAGGPAKVAVCRQLGADEAIDYRGDDFVGAVRELTGGRGADVIYDPVGGDVFDRSLKVVAFEGRVVVVGFSSGRIPQVPANHVLVKNYSVVGLHWGLYRRRDPAVVEAAHSALADLAARGLIAPYVSEEVPLRGAPAALQRMAERGAVGKVVVLPSG